MSARMSGPSAACRRSRRGARRVEFGEQAGGQRDFERAQQAEREDAEDQCDESVDPWIGAELNDAEGSDGGGDAESQGAEQDDDAEARTRAACTSPPRWFRKKETVIGIIGKTQGVKIAASPSPKAVSRNVARLSGRGWRRGVRWRWRGRGCAGFHFGVSGGDGEAPGSAAAGSTFT